MKTMFSKKNVNLLVGLISLLLFLWLIMYAIPGIFVNLFDTILGKFILLGLILLACIYNLKIGFGMAVILVILYQFSHMKQ
jgi:hypothetical protein